MLRHSLETRGVGDGGRVHGGGLEGAGNQQPRIRDGDWWDGVGKKKTHLEER